MNAADFQQAEDDLVAEKTAHILHDTGLRMRDLQQNQPVLDVGAGYGFLGRFGVKNNIQVISLEPQEVHFGEQVIYQLAVKRLLERKSKHEKPHFTHGVLNLRRTYPFAQAVAVALNRHGIPVEKDEIQQWSERIAQPDTLPYVRNDIQDASDIGSASVGLVVSRKAPPLHPLTTLDSAQTAATEILRVLKKTKRAHIGPGPINASLDVNGEFTQRNLNDPTQCMQETEALLRHLFEGSDVTAHTRQNTSAQYYTATKQ